MKKIGLYILYVIIGIIVIACGYCMIQGHIIQDKTYSYLETYGYTDEDIEQVDLKHSFLNKLLGYNEWRISVEFKKEPDIYYWFTYRNHEILKTGISSGPMFDKHKMIDYYEKFNNGWLKLEDNCPLGYYCEGGNTIDDTLRRWNSSDFIQGELIDDDGNIGEEIFEPDRHFSAFGNNPDRTLTAEPRDIEGFDKRYDVRFYEGDDLNAGTLMHLFKFGENYRFLYDKLDIKFIKGECNDGIQGEHKKAESNYKVIIDFWGEKSYEGCGNTRTEKKTMEKEPEVISPDDEQRIQYLENLVSGDINNNETIQPQENYEVYYDKESDILVATEEPMDISHVINLKIGNAVFDVTLEENSTTKALIEKLHEGDVVVNAREYGGFEKVGNLGFDLPRADKQITTEPGDLVLYQGNQISLFYESNSWSYTKLGKVQMISKDGLKEILGDGDVTLVFSLLK